MCSSTTGGANKRRRSRSSSRMKRKDQRATGRQFQRKSPIAILCYVAAVRCDHCKRNAEQIDKRTATTVEIEEVKWVVEPNTGHGVKLLFVPWEAPRKLKKLTSHPLSHDYGSSCTNTRQCNSEKGQPWTLIETRRQWNACIHITNSSCQSSLKKQEKDFLRAVLQADQEARVRWTIFLRNTPTASLQGGVSDTAKNQGHAKQHIYAAAV